MSHPVRLIVGTTNVVCRATDCLPSYWEAVRQFANKYLQTFAFDPRRRRFMPDKTYYKFNGYQQIITIPVNFLPDIKDHLKSRGIPFNEHSDRGYMARSLTVNMRPEFTDRPHQTPGIDYLVNDPADRVGLQLQTGKGKTYSATKGAVRIGNVFMVIVSGLVDQWQQSISEQTDGEDKIWVIQGYKSLVSLFKSDIMPEIFICSLETIRAYIKHKGNYEDLPRYHEFIKYYGIGTKIVDEAHLNFHAGTIVDMSYNVQRNIYLTATFDTANKALVTIFDRVFPEEMRYGANDYHKYVNVTFYGFNGYVPEKKCTSSRGYNHSKYEQFLLKKEPMLYDWLQKVILPIIRSHFIHKAPDGMKCLVFCRTIEMATVLSKAFALEFPDKKCMRYVGADPESHLTDGEIITSTHKSAGTGTDIANLFTVVNLVSFKAPTTAKQVIGRLRVLKNTDLAPEYVDILDMSMRSHIRHWTERSRIIKACAKQYNEYKIP